MTPIVFGKEYDFEFTKEDYSFKIKDGKNIIYSMQLKHLNNKITIFKNITATITSLILLKTSGEEINVNLQDEYKQKLDINNLHSLVVSGLNLNINFILFLSSSKRLLNLVVQNIVVTLLGILSSSSNIAVWFCVLRE